MRGRRRAQAASLGAVLALVGALSSYAATPKSCPNVVSSGPWTSIDAPTRVVAFAVAAGAPGRIFVTDGKNLYATSDGGCSWRLALSLPALPSESYPFAGESIAALAAPTVDDVYLGVTGPHGILSHDGGRTWATSDGGLVGRGDPNQLTAAPSDADVLYMTVDTRAGDDALNNGFTTSTSTRLVASSLFRSTDRGATWELVDVPSAVVRQDVVGQSQGTPPGAIWSLSVSPRSARRLWIAGTDGVYTSADGGESWSPSLTRSDVPGLDVRAVDAVGGAAVGVAAIDPSTGDYFTTPSDDDTVRWSRSRFVGFKSWSALTTVAPWVWAAHSGRGALLVTGPKGVFRSEDGIRWSDVTPVTLEWTPDTMTSPVADPADDNAFYLRLWQRPPTLMRYDASPAGERASTERGSGASDEGTAAGEVSTSFGRVRAPEAARLSPQRTEIRLGPGSSTTRTYSLELPPRPSPLDVYFLLDSTSSMKNVIRLLARSAAAIVTELRGAGIDVWAGLGEFRTYPYPGEEWFNYPYRRDVAVAPPGPRLVRALLGMEAGGNSGANLTGLLQAASGAGQRILPAGTSAGDIPAGLDAGFRDDAIKVILHFADNWFATPGRGDPNGRYRVGWPGPTFEQAIAALNEAGVHQVGAAVGYAGAVSGSSTSTQQDPRRDLARVAAGTGTLAPPEGIDCDGDGRTDVPGGRALVCGVNGEHTPAFASAIVTLLEAVRDVSSVRLVEETTSGALAGIAPSIYPELDLHRPHRLDFEVTFECQPGDAGRSFDVELAALLGDARVDAASATVTCRRRSSPAAAGRGADAVPVQAVPVVPPPPPPPPPPNPVPGPANAPQPQPNPNQQPNPNPQAQPHPAAVAQRQAQPQAALVLAAQHTRQQMQMEYAMSSLSAPPDPLERVKYGLGAAALSMLLAYGYVTALRRSPRGEPSWVKS